MRSLHALTLGLFAACLGALDAVACFVPSSERTLFLNEVPRGVEVSVIARVTVMAVGESNISDEPIRYAVARVDQIIKGEIGRPVIWIGIRRVACGDNVAPGQSGIVAGSLLQRAQGSLELMPLFARPVPPRRKDVFLEGPKP